MSGCIKPACLAALLLFISLIFQGCSSDGSGSGSMDSFRQVEKQFTHPSRNFGPWIKWVLKPSAVQEEIDFQINEFAEKGAGGLMVVPFEPLSGAASDSVWDRITSRIRMRADSMGMRSLFLKDRAFTSWETEQSEPRVWKVGMRRAAGDANRQELFPVSGDMNAVPGMAWTFAGFKAAADRLFCLGANSLSLPWSFYSAGTSQASDCRSFSYHESWWDLCRPLIDAFSRTCMALSAGTSVSHFLVIEPQPDSSASRSQLRFGAFLDSLDRMHAEYDLIGETALEKTARIWHGKLTAGACAYSALILPPDMPRLRPAVNRLIETFIRDGGTVLSFRGRPEESVAETENSRGEKTDFAHPEQVAFSDSGIARKLASPDFSISVSDSCRGRLMHCRRQLTDGQLLFLSNMSGHEVRGTVRVPGQAAYVLKPWDGSVKQYPFRISGDLMSLKIQLPPGNSLLVFCAAVDTFGIHTADPEYTDGRILKPDDRLSILPVYYNAWKIPGSRSRSAPEPFTHTDFVFTCHPQVDRSSLMAVLTCSDPCSVSVNGSHAAPMPDAWLMDRDYSVYDIGALTRAGENSLSAWTSQKDPDSYALILYGDFMLIRSGETWRMGPPRALKPGPWADQGMPFYTDAVSYMHVFTIQEGSGNVRIRLGPWRGAVAEILVNDLQAGIVGWPPCTLDLTGRFREGANYIEVRIYGSAAGPCGPPDDAPLSGEDPDFNPGASGLYRDFTLIERHAADAVR